MENQSKVKKILLSVWLAVATVLSVIFIIVCIVGGVLSSKNNKHSASAYVEHDIVAYNINNDINKHDIKPIIKEAVAYNDNQYKITLSVDELNNYSFNSFNSYISSTLYGNGHIASIITNITYNLNTYEVDEDIINQSNSYFSYVYGSNYIMFNFDIDEPNNKFAYVENNNPIDFEGDIVLNIEQQSYDDVKQAIESDIAVNSSNINDSVFETLTSSTVGFIGAISSGISSVIAVFYTNNSLTVLGTLAVIVVAVSLAYFVFRLIFGLVRMRG